MDELKKYSPQFNHVNDALAFVVHLSFLSEKCKLIGLNEEQYLDDLGSIPQGWNKSNEIYQFRYILKSNDPQKQKQKMDVDKQEEEKKDDNKPKNTILVKILSMEQNELLITAVKQGSNDVFTLEVTLTDHIDTKKASNDLTNYQNIYKDIDGLKVLLIDQITHKVIPQKKKKEDEEDEDKEKKKKQPPRNPLIFPEPDAPDNPLFIGGGRPRPGIPYGGGDMDPFGGGGGNLFGPDQIRNQFNRNNSNDPNGNRPPMVPPNARFDPYGPDGMPPGPDPNHFKPPKRGPGSGGFGGGGFGGGFGGFM